MVKVVEPTSEIYFIDLILAMITHRDIFIYFYLQRHLGVENLKALLSNSYVHFKVNLKANLNYTERALLCFSSPQYFYWHFQHFSLL